ncbi:hypothetical protein [Nocardioides sp.]|uniref:hypothetical protein n=1 Tax=Nocardioides sp. TaxID=35761 RepID=UPI0035AEB629
MSTDLREELDALARTQTFSPDPSAWDRGRRARRRARAGRVAAAVAVVALVVGVGAVAFAPDRDAPQPAETPRGALPSRVDLREADFGAEFETDYAIGRASVALANGLLLVDAEDGTYHRFGVVADIVALSPDGYRVAWWSRGSIDPDRISLADLRTGEVTEWAFNQGAGGKVTALSWWPDSAHLLWQGRSDDGAPRAALIDVPGSSEEYDFHGRYGARGIPSPSRDIVALPSDGEVAAAPFEQVPERGSGRMTGIPVDRALPADLHPDGAVVTPIGWADEDHVVAIIDPPPSDVVERPRLAVFTSPDQPESAWTYREFLPRLPPEATSFAVDLIPDLTGDPDQELTHDFSADAPADERDISWLIGLGVAAAIAVLMALRWLWRRMLG